MSVINARVGKPASLATATRLSASARASSCVVQNAPLPCLTSISNACSAGGQLLGQDAGGDQRQRLHRAGGVADRVEPAVGRRDARAGADDRAAGVAQRALERRAIGRRAVAGQRLELVQRAAGVAEAAPRDHRHHRAAGGERSAPAPGSPCRRRRRWSACRAAGRRSGRATSRAPAPDAAIARVSSVVSARVMPRRQIAIASAATWPSLQLRDARPRTKASICAPSSAAPSRLARMISCARRRRCCGRGSVHASDARRARPVRPCPSAAT